jgi:hypothetical protein
VAYGVVLPINVSFGCGDENVRYLRPSSMLKINVKRQPAWRGSISNEKHWIPACAGMTD